jgi:hypothetical protein
MYRHDTSCRVETLRWKGERSFGHWRTSIIAGAWLYPFSSSDILKQPLLEVMGTGVSGAEANGYAINFLTVRALAAPAVLYHFSSNRHPLRIPGHQNTNLDSSLRQSGQFCARRCSHRKFPHGPAWSCNRHYNSGMD